MRIRVLGPHGGELPGCRSTCLLVNDTLALDAGALTSMLQLDELSRVDNILLTHSHFDHVKDLPMLADVLVGRRDAPVIIHSNTQCIKSLEKNLFNDVLWPDFTEIPTKRQPVYTLKSFKAGASKKIGSMHMKSILVNHPVEACGFILNDGDAQLAISGDTGPTEKFWKFANAAENLKILFVECSFPNRLQGLADISGHFTPQSLEQELKEKFKQPKGCEVVLYHLKPAFVDDIKREVRHMPVHVAELGELYEF